ncbi:lysophospholipid acyltransferase family protein [Maridesulfovibrio ferrireducens]|uniref:lysophospholipid acyltransferase family protein n=1 Tax=Maridesulfovibrio ferrireducens TaxID=246191 RepID=UPI001A222B5A|nr:lysophospholipid acyltransferase family protein [Maridesulfovibrio ferrireducens]MBI9111459.1 lysophospholipid acyltransferase family protein [Maridesulfovibrio ferrireducens]
MKIKVKPSLVAAPMAFFYKALTKTLRFDVEGLENLIEIMDRKEPVMLALWHNELFALTSYGMTKGFPYVTMASDSRDGQIITETLERLGFKVARGSSTRGGVKAMLGMTRLMKREGCIGIITVDGPKGPRHKVKQGILAIAQKTDSLIIPIRGYVENPMVFKKSWDHFEVAKPFSRCKVFMDKPFKVTDQKLSPEILESEAAKIEAAMDNLGSGF